MPAKRKSELPPEPSPPAKERKTKAPASEKKRVRGDPPLTGTKGKKKKSDDEDAASAAADAVFAAARTAALAAAALHQSPSPTPAKKRVSRKTAEKATPATEPKPSREKKIRASRKSIAGNELNSAEESSFKKSNSTRRKSFAATTSPAASVSDPPPAAAPASATTVAPVAPAAVNVAPALSTSHALASEDANKLTDEVEIMSLWHQCWQAMYICMSIIGPVFFSIMLVCYFFGKLNDSQAIASVGVAYTVLLAAIMGSYVMVMLPFVLIARVFTSVVAPTTTDYTPDQVNLYCRLLLLFALAAMGVGYKYFGV